MKNCNCLLKFKVFCRLALENFLATSESSHALKYYLRQLRLKFCYCDSFQSKRNHRFQSFFSSQASCVGCLYSHSHPIDIFFRRQNMNALNLVPMEFSEFNMVNLIWKKTISKFQSSLHCDVHVLSLHSMVVYDCLHQLKRWFGEKKHVKPLNRNNKWNVKRLLFRCMFKSDRRKHSIPK